MFGRSTWDPRNVSTPAPVDTFEVDRRIAEVLACPPAPFTPLARKCPVIPIEHLRYVRARRLAREGHRPMGGAA